MKRRSFLKRMIGVAAAVAMPATAKTTDNKILLPVTAEKVKKVESELFPKAIWNQKALDRVYDDLKYNEAIEYQAKQLAEAIDNDLIDQIIVAAEELDKANVPYKDRFVWNEGVLTEQDLVSAGRSAMESAMSYANV